MAFFKSTFWSVSAAFIPVICGNPCEFQGRGGTTGFVGFETGMATETGVFVDPIPPAIESISISCTPDELNWSYLVEASGMVGVARVYPRYVVDGSTSLSEEHDMNWDFHPTNGDWSLFSLSLPAATGSDWESGLSTLIPCEDPSYVNNAWMIEVWDSNGVEFACALFGEQANLYTMDFPGCSIWE